MDAARETRSRRPAGMSRLLTHCETLARVTSEHSATARVRLESELGPELAQRLVGALAARGGGRSAAIV